MNDYWIVRAKWMGYISNPELNGNGETILGNSVYNTHQRQNRETAFLFPQSEHCQHYSTRDQALEAFSRWGFHQTKSKFKNIRLCHEITDTALARLVPRIFTYGSPNLVLSVENLSA